MAKHEQYIAGAEAASGKMGRKEFEKELAKLQVELTRLQTWPGKAVAGRLAGRDSSGTSPGASAKSIFKH
jgi:hypothetical protein